MYSKKRVFTAEEDMTVRTLIGMGVTLTEVASRIGIGRTLTRERAIEIGCYVQTVPKTAWSSDEDAQIRRMLAGGSTYAAIGEALGRSVDSVQRRASRLGVRPLNNRVVPRLKKTVEREPPRAQDNEPVVEGPTIVDLTACQCRWPVGVNADAQYVFCGAERSTRAYCVEHTSIAWRARP